MSPKSVSPDKSYFTVRDLCIRWNVEIDAIEDFIFNQQVLRPAFKYGKTFACLPMGTSKFCVGNTHGEIQYVKSTIHAAKHGNELPVGTWIYINFKSFTEMDMEQDYNFFSVISSNFSKEPKAIISASFELFDGAKIDLSCKTRIFNSEKEEYDKEIRDVWVDSGSTWQFTPEEVKARESRETAQGNHTNDEQGQRRKVKNLILLIAVLVEQLIESRKFHSQNQLAQELNRIGAKDHIEGLSVANLENIFAEGNRLRTEPK